MHVAGLAFVRLNLRVTGPGTPHSPSPWTRTGKCPPAAGRRRRLQGRSQLEVASHWAVAATHEESSLLFALFAAQAARMDTGSSGCAQGVTVIGLPGSGDQASPRAA
jgi:hypothetical protein